ncbi:hypothetical protein EJB05_57936, partial [Eragrostis curvula]
MARLTKLPCFLLLCLGSFALVSSGSRNYTDERALLSFKSKVSSGLSNLLTSWNGSSHFCSWPGVFCGRRHPDRVVALRMSSFNLSGVISSFLGNLSFLRRLDLHGNQLVGRVPWELGQLSRLQVLNLSINHLQGSIPVTLGGCNKLRILDLSNNQLQGKIPHEMGTLKSLIVLSLENNDLSGQIPQSLTGLQSIKYFSLHSNRLSGRMPSFWGNLTNLKILYLGSNMLLGTIPSSLGMLSSLTSLDLAHNNFSGLVPTSLWNISSLMEFSLQLNMLRGTIPANAFNYVPYLRRLYMDSNQFHGPIPSSISNASNLMLLSLSTNFFSGIVPKEIGRLKGLNWLQLSGNLLQATEPKDWEFLTALTNCSKLQILGFCDSKFEGVLPDTISNHSNSLTLLSLYNNRISGRIPKYIEYGAGNMVSIQGDIYSYGILVLETVTGKRPTDSRFRQGLSLREHVDLALQNRVTDAVDTRLSLDVENELHTRGDAPYKKKIDSIVSLLELGMSCTQELPSSRMPTEGIIKELLAIKDCLVGERRT